MDMPNELILGFNPSPLVHPNTRGLKMRNPRVVWRFSDHLNQDFFKEDMYYRMDSLHHSTKEPLV